MEDTGGNDIRNSIVRETLAIKLFNILNDENPIDQTIADILKTIKVETNFGAVGIRLRKDDDYPYFAQDGFSKDFLITENTLNVKNSTGGICRDKDGNISLECTCGIVLSGQADSTNTLFTEGGSFWTNDSIPLLDLPRDQDPRLHPRNNCIHHGFRSIALIPIRNKSKIIGLLQLNDRRINRLSIETVRFFEGISASIGIALSRIHTTSVLKDSESHFRLILENTDAGYFFIDKEGIIRDVNNAWVRLYKYNSKEDIIGQHFEIIQRPGDVEAARVVIQGILNGDPRHLSGEFSRKCADMSVGWHSFSARPVMQDDKVIGIEGILIDITERKKAEELMSENERKYRQLFESISEGVVLHEMIYDGDDKALNYRIVDANPMFEVHTGIAIKTAIGCLATEVYKTDSAPYLEIYDQVIKTGKSSSFESYFPPLQKHFTISIFSPRKGWFATIFSDITARTKAKEAIQESEEKYRLLHESAGIGIGYYNLDGTVISYNRLAAGHMNGLPEDFAGKSIYEIFPKSEAVFYHDRIKNTGLSDNPVVYEDLVPLPIGNKYFLSTFTKITNSTNGIIGIQILSQDITQLKLAEKKLEESEDKYRSLFSQTKSGITLQQIVFDKDNNPVDYYTLDMNLSAEQLLGLKKEDVVGKPVGEMLPPDELTKWLSQFSKVAIEGGSSHYEQYSPHNGKVFEGQVFCPKKGQFAVIFDDVTDKKKTAEMLQNAQKLESLGLLAGGIAHDFNNLLGAIFGYIDMAIEQTSEKKVSSYLAKSISSIDRARGLTQQLLTFAKGGAPIKDVNHLFPFVQETAQFALSGSNVLCQFNISNNLHSCNYDRNQIGQVIDNIIINAQQAMPNGGTITISAENVCLRAKRYGQLPSGDYVLISINDSGIGIPPDILPRIFDPFYTTKATGHGLGLATCFSIIDRHGGCIDVESEQGKGSTFRVILPASKGSVSASKPRKTKKHSGSGTFLIMDDEEVMQQMIGDMLTLIGYTVVCKISGQEAIEYFTAENKKKRKLAGMIFDLTIPGGMGGKEAVREIRKICSKTPIFVSSGYAEDPVMSSPTDYGFTASICKPFRKTELAAMLNKYM